MTDPIRVLSLGAGVQSSTVLRMSIAGELDRLDHCVFADTGWEPPAVYDTLEALRLEAKSAGIGWHTVRAGNIRDNEASGLNTTGQRFNTIPFYQRGGKGMGRRQCTSNYKIKPILKKLRELAGYKKRQRIPVGTVEQWFGISVDEVQRATVNGDAWVTNYYPLIEVDMNRHDCLRWNESHGFPEPPRSACIGCPYKTDAEWAWMRDNEPALWDDACRFDEEIRQGRGGEQFVHQSCYPLRVVKLRPGIDTEQTRLNFGGGCGAGVCGV